MIQWLLAYQKELVLVSVSVVVSVSVLASIVVPKRRALGETVGVARTLDAKISESSTALDQFERLVEQGGEHQDSRLNTDEELLTHLLEILAGLGTKHDLEIVSMKPQSAEAVDDELKPEDDHGVFSMRFSIHMSVRANYRDVGRYLDELEEIPILVAVRDLKMRREKSGSTKLIVDFRIETFSMATNDKKT